MIPPAFGSEFYSVVQIKVMHPLLNGQYHFRARDVVLIPIDYGPNRFFSDRPTARKHSKMKHRGKGFPLLTYKERRDAAFNRGYAPCSFAVPRCDPVPDTPDVLPTLPTDSVEKRELQVICLVTIPAIRDVHHMPGFEPFVTIDPGSEGEFILAPG